MAKPSLQNGNGKNTLPPKKILLLLAGVTILILLSEGLYILKNGSPAITRYFIEKAQTSARQSNIQASLNNLQIAARINIYYQAKLYPKLIPNRYSLKINVPEENPGLIQSWGKYLQNLIPNSQSNPPLAKIFYTLGLLAYRNNQSDLVIPFWQTAVYLEPELSHYHVELANFWLVSGDQKKAKNGLDFCLKFKYPVKHCQEYVDSNLSKNSPEEVGFLEKGLEEYYKSVGP